MQIVNYWKEESGSRYTLYVSDEAKATVNTSTNTLRLYDTQAEQEVVVPDSRAIYDVAEELIGVERVTEFRTSDNLRTLINWREMAERRADQFRQRCPPDHEAKYCFDQAWHTLNHICTSENDGLSNRANEARLILAQALTLVEANHGRWTDESKHLAIQAEKSFRDPPSASYERCAWLDCAKGVACLQGLDVSERQDRVRSRTELWERLIKENCRPRNREIERERD